MKQYHESRLWFEASLTICEQVSGKQSINTATLLFQLSQALALDKDMRGAANRMRESYKIFNAVLGSEDRNTKEAGQWLEQFTQTAVTQAKQLQDLAKGKVRRVQLNTRGTLRPQPQVGQTSAQADGREPRSILNQFRDQRSVEELLKYIEGGDSPKKASPKKQTTNPKRRAQKADGLGA
jgi:protein TIF31